MTRCQDVAIVRKVQTIAKQIAETAARIDADKEPVEGEEGEAKEASLVANCGFHLQPGVTTSFKVYTLYREDVPCPEEIVGGDDKSEEEKEKEARKAEEKLYYTQAIPLVEGLDQ